jgi:hypothetical protein
MLRRSKSATQTSHRVAWAGGPHVAPREHQPYNGQDLAIGCGHFVHRDSGVDDPCQSAVGANKESTRAAPRPGPPGQHLPGPAAHWADAAGLPPAGRVRRPALRAVSLAIFSADDHLWSWTKAALSHVDGWSRVNEGAPLAPGEPGRPSCKMIRLAERGRDGH